MGFFREFLCKPSLSFNTPLSERRGALASPPPVSEPPPNAPSLGRPLLFLNKRCFPQRPLLLFYCFFISVFFIKKKGPRCALLLIYLPFPLPASSSGALPSGETPLHGRSNSRPGLAVRAIHTRERQRTPPPLS